MENAGNSKSNKFFVRGKNFQANDFLPETHYGIQCSSVHWLYAIIEKRDRSYNALVIVSVGNLLLIRRLWRSILDQTEGIKVKMANEKNETLTDTRVGLHSGIRGGMLECRLPVGQPLCWNGQMETIYTSISSALIGDGPTTKAPLAIAADQSISHSFLHSWVALGYGQFGNGRTTEIFCYPLYSESRPSLLLPLFSALEGYFNNAYTKRKFFDTSEDRNAETEILY